MLLPFKLIFNVSLADGTRRGDCKCASVTLPAVLTPQMAWSFFAILTGMIWKISTFPIWKKARANALVLSPHLTDVSPCFAVPAQAGCQEPPEAGLEIAWSQTARGFILCVVTWTFESSTRLCNGESRLHQSGPAPPQKPAPGSGVSRLQRQHFFWSCSLLLTNCFLVKGSYENIPSGKHVKPVTKAVWGITWISDSSFSFIISGETVENTSVRSNKNGVAEAIRVLFRFYFPSRNCLLYIISLFNTSSRNSCSSSEFRKRTACFKDAKVIRSTLSVHVCLKGRT